MTLQAIAQYIAIPPLVGRYVYGTMGMTAAGHKAAFIFQVPKTGNIAKVGIRVGTVTSAQTLKISLQGVDASGFPDGTIMSSGNAYGTQASPATDTFYLVTLTSAAAVTLSNHIAVVVEWSGTAGNLQITGIQFGATTIHSGYGVLYTASWAKQLQIPCCALEYDDGSYGGGTTYPASAMGSTIFNSGSTPDERGLYFQVPFPCRAVGAGGYFQHNGASNTYQMVLYDSDGSTVLATASPTAIAVATNDYGHHFWLFSATTNLSKDTWYRLVIKPTSVNGATIVDWTLPTGSGANIMDSLPLGQKCYKTSRTDAGAWTQDSAIRPQLCILLNAFDDGVGGGSGGPVSGNMRGGFING